MFQNRTKKQPLYCSCIGTENGGFYQIEISCVAGRCYHDNALTKLMQDKIKSFD